MKQEKNSSQGLILNLFWRYLIGALLIWSAIVGGSLIWNLHLTEGRAMDLAHNEALANFNKDQAFRLWATKHGGVYVPITPKSIPSPFLSHIPERDIETLGGRKLTLLDPASMVRQLMEDYSDLYGIRGKITSKNVLYPGNAPDEWERVALQRLEEGEKEVLEVAQLNGEPYLRLMRPMYMQKGCEKCHASQGFRDKDFIGGVDVSIPITPYFESQKGIAGAFITTHGLIWILGISGIGFGARQVYNRLLADRQMKQLTTLHRSELEQEVDTRRRKEQALLESEQFARALIDASLDGVITMDDDGLIQSFNKASSKIFGFSESEVIGKPVAMLMPEDSRQAHAEGVARYLKTGQQRVLGVGPIKVRGQRKDGTSFPLELSLNQLQLDQHLFVGMLRDITEQVRLEEVMIQSEKMMSVGRLAAGMAHEINNPLAGILQSMQVITNRLSPELAKNRSAAERAGIDIPSINDYMQQRQIDQLIRSVIESGSRAAHIVNSMLSFSRKSAAEKANIDLTQLMDETIELAANDYDLKKSYDFRHIIIERDYEPDLPQVYCEQNEIQQVIINLLKNGAQAMAVERVEKSPQFTIRIRRDGPQLCFQIEDNGPGINDESSKHIFEPFYTTKGIGEGTGLGLSVSYFIVTENHGGNMWVKPAPGGGACFIVCLPIEG